MRIKDKDIVAELEGFPINTIHCLRRNKRRVQFYYWLCRIDNNVFEVQIVSRVDEDGSIIKTVEPRKSKKYLNIGNN